MELIIVRKGKLSDGVRTCLPRGCCRAEEIAGCSTLFIHSFIHSFQTTEVHRHTHKTYNIHRKKEHRKRDRQKETKHTHETRRTILLSQTDSLLAKLIGPRNAKFRCPIDVSTLDRLTHPVDTGCDR